MNFIFQKDIFHGDDLFGTGTLHVMHVASFKMYNSDYIMFIRFLKEPVVENETTESA